MLRQRGLCIFVCAAQSWHYCRNNYTQITAVTVDVVLDVVVIFAARTTAMTATAYVVIAVLDAMTTETKRTVTIVTAVI